MPAQQRNHLKNLLSLDSLKRYAEARSFSRGESYFNSGAVRSLRIDDTSVSATVTGTRKYNTRVWGEDGSLEYSCSCPVGYDGSFCKHCVAVGLAWFEESRKDTGVADAKSVAPFGMKDVRKYLLGLPQEEIVGMLLEYANSDERLHRNLMTNVARSVQQDLDLSIWKNAIEEAAWTDGFIYYRDMYEYISGIDEVIDSIEGLFKEGHSEGVIELAEYALSVVERATGEVDDSDGGMGSILYRLQDIHLAACKKVKPEQEDLAKRLFVWELNGDFDVFRNSIFTYKKIFGKKGIETYRKMTEEEWEKIPALKPGQKDYHKYGKRFRITSMMMNLAQLSGDIEQVVEVKKRDLSNQYDFLKIAETYQKAKQYKKALEWAEKGWRAFPESTGDARLREFITNAYHKKGRHDEAMKLTWAAFATSPDFGSYRTLKSHATKAKQWKAWRDKALACIREKIRSNKKKSSKTGHGFRFHGYSGWKDNSVLVDIYIHEKKLKKAWQEANSGGCHDGLWLELAEKRENDHPLDSINIYKDHVERLLLHADQRNYLEAVQYIENIEKLMEGSGEANAFADYVTTIRNGQKRKRNFMKLLDKKKW